MTDKFDGVLIHHGVKGMKWGVRRTKEALNRAAGRVAPSRKERNVQSARKKAYSSRRTMKQSDLDAMVKRLEQEKRLKTLLSEDLRPGRTKAKQILNSSGMKVAGAVGTGALMFGVKYALEKKWGTSGAEVVAKGILTNMPKIKK